VKLAANTVSNAESIESIDDLEQISIFVDIPSEDVIFENVFDETMKITCRQQKQNIKSVLPSSGVKIITENNFGFCKLVKDTNEMMKYKRDLNRYENGQDFTFQFDDSFDRDIAKEKIKSMLLLFLANLATHHCVNYIEIQLPEELLI